MKASHPETSASELSVIARNPSARLERTDDVAIPFMKVQSMGSPRPSALRLAGLAMTGAFETHFSSVVLRVQN